MTEGIYILANDIVYDQLVALLNSIEANAGKKYPICIIPYDERLERVKCELQNRTNVTIFEDNGILKSWNEFATKVWQAHPNAFKIWQENGISGIYRHGMHRRFSCFDGPFEKFIYLDADIVILNSLEYVFQQLNKNDFVVYDFQYKDPKHVYNLNSDKLLDIFSEARITNEIFCAGMYGSKKGLFNERRREELISWLEKGEAEILYMNAPDQTILNYMIMRSGISSYNFALHLSKSERTGCSVTSNHFEEKNNILYDRGNRLTYLHYIGLESQLFTNVCSGKNIDFPYREVFLHYRYLHEPNKRPKFKRKPKAYNAPASLFTRLLRKLGLAS
ncbi:Npun_R2821/Npun_R2822 family protein [Scytonema sp. NUACC26]|uniref:Npun_R2821/Npun_R2822 family protein n=1 Tax=Scytonema sp. NUACC26 TaxID=3140176 RepID=UPI0034DCBB8D